MFGGNIYLSVSFFIVAKLQGTRIAQTLLRLSQFTTDHICIVSCTGNMEKVQIDSARMYECLVVTFWVAVVSHDNSHLFAKNYFSTSR